MSGTKGSFAAGGNQETDSRRDPAEQEMALEQNTQTETETQEHTDQLTESTQVKRPRGKESPHTHKKSKTTKALEKEFIDSS